MRTVQDLTFGVTGQLVTFDAPQGRPSAVTSVEVFRWSSDDTSDEESTALGAGSVETGPSTTTDAAAGSDQADPTLIPLTATTGCEVGRTYLLTSATGAKEWAEVAEVESGVSVTAKHPLINTFTSGAALVSTRIQATIDATWVADDDNIIDGAGPNPMFRVRWVYVVDGTTYVADSYFNLVRYRGLHNVQPQDVDACSPGWLDRLPIDHRDDQGRRLIDEAYRAVKLDLHAVWTDDSAVANAEVVDDLTRWKALELTELARYMTTGQSGGYEVTRGVYRERLDALVRIAVKVPIRTSDGGATQRSALGLTRR